MSQAADLADAIATPPDSAGEPSADWGDDLAEWYAISSFLQSPPDRNGRVTLTYPAEYVANLTFTGTNAHDLVPGDNVSPYPGTIDLAHKRIAFEVAGKWY